MKGIIIYLRDEDRERERERERERVQGGIGMGKENDRHTDRIKGSERKISLEKYVNSYTHLNIHVHRGRKLDISK